MYADDESGIVMYKWAVGSGVRPGQQVMEFVSVGTATNASCVTGRCLALEEGGKYFVTVRAFNGAGLMARLDEGLLSLFPPHSRLYGE